MNTKGKKQLWLWLALLAMILWGTGWAQEPIGGPYTADANTMLLLHFEGDFTNESQFSQDGVGHGNYSFFPVSADASLGQSLRLDNDAPGDSAYVTVADTVYLDLTGDWTIEGWINIFTFGGVGSHRWVPRLVIKTGDQVFWRPNYFVEMWGDNRFFSFGYHNAGQSCWPQVNTPNNFMEPGIWYHLAFIRDTSNQILINMIHTVQGGQRTLAYFGVTKYTDDPFCGGDFTPITTDQPVHIGWAGGGSTDSWLDGFVDEIRISNVVRNFAIPPVIINQTVLQNQPTSVSQYDVSADVFKVGAAGTIQSVEVLYSTDDGQTWNSVSLSPSTGNTYTGAIPGQNLGTVVHYYYKATDSDGRVSTQPGGAETDSIYYSFGVYQPNTMTLHLTFDEGTGLPQDQSAYQNPVTLVGNPTYSSNAAQGPFSMYFEGDSSYLEIDRPFLASPTFTLDFWFNMDSLEAFRRIVSLGTGPGSSNYMVFLMNDSTLTAESSIPGMAAGLRDLLKLDTKIQAGTWYRVRYQLGADSALLQLFDANNALIEQKGVGPSVITGPADRLDGRFRIALLYNHTGYYGGYVDDVKVWNYPLDLPTGIEPIEDNQITRFQLEQNYPNPFNPSTDIRFSLDRTDHVQLTIYDVLGRKVKTLVDKQLVAGRYKVDWDGTNELGQPVASGIYIYRLQVRDRFQARKMVLMR